MWEPAAQGKITKWNQVNPAWPDAPIKLFGAGADSGTFDYFTEAVTGKSKSSRGDFTASEDDNVLVQGVAMDKLALGFFGYAYYKENAAKLRVVGIDDEKDDNGKGPITPSPSSVIDGSYSPLSRPIFIYLSRAALERSEVDTFARFYIEHAPTLVGEVGYISLPPRAYELALRRLSSRVVGSVFGGSGSRVGVSVEALLAAE